MAKKNKNNKSKTIKSFDLRGDNNWETALNTVNVGLGLTATTIFTSASLVTNGAEIILDKAVPRNVAKAIVDTACSEGLMATVHSIGAEDSTQAATDTLYKWKNKFLGGKKVKTNTKHLDRELAKLDKDTFEQVEIGIKTYIAVVKGLTRTKISSMIKKHGLQDTMLKLDKEFAKA